jgi:hypothetical protein
VDEVQGVQARRLARQFAEQFLSLRGLGVAQHLIQRRALQLFQQQELPIRQGAAGPTRSQRRGNLEQPRLHPGQVQSFAHARRR